MSTTQDWPSGDEPVGILGEGAPGRVFKLRDRATGQLVAGKRFLLSNDVKALGRIEREIEILRRLRHKAIITLIAVEKNETSGFLVTEFVEGVSLEAMIEAHGGITPGRALMLAAQLADGLSCAASHGVVHRDVKPSNILVCVHDLPKLLD